MEAVKKIKKVMLVYPNQRWLKHDLTTTWNLSPYALCLLAAMLEDKYEVKIIDAQFQNLTQEQLKEEIIKYQPDCVGVSVLTSEYAPILDITVKIIKAVNRNIITIAGGVHVTTQYYRVMENRDVDYAVRGEGEYVLNNFLDYLNGERAMPEKGIVYREKDGTIKHLPPDLIEDLDSLPLPNYELVDYSAYTNTGPRYGVDTINLFPYARILTSRGCPIGCSFCQVESISGRKWRSRSPEKVVDELVMLKEKYGIKAFIFEDDNPFCSKERTKKMLRLIIERKLNLKWKAAGVAVVAMDEEIFRLMSESGCQLIGMAIESGSERILKQVIKKPVDLQKVPELIKTAQKYGIFVVGNFIIGFPGETWAEIRQTLRFAETCGLDYCKIYPANPLVGTRMFDIAKKMNCIVGDEDKVDWRYGRIRSEEFGPKDISILRVYEWDRINFTDSAKRAKTAAIMGLSVEKLEEIRKATRENLIFDNA